jgi:MFS family permease
MSVDMFAVLFGGATAMLPVFAKDILHVDATGMGLLKAAQGVGTILMLFYLTKKPLKNAQGKTMLYCVAMFGLCILVFAVSKNFWLSFAALLFSGVFDAVSMLVRSTIMQLYVPDDMRGRVGSVNSMFINSSNELGQFESGMAAKLLGTVPSVLFGGTMTIIVVLIAWVKAPTLRKLEY